MHTQEFSSHKSATDSSSKNSSNLPIEGQNTKDGTLVFLRSDLWKPNYEILSLGNYKEFASGKVNLILATLRTGERFLLAAAHGNSNKPEDGRGQIQHIKETFDKLRTLPENTGLQLLIGIDANTKTEASVQDLHNHLEALGLIGTSVGPTTIKKRMLTAQHHKIGRVACDEEDFLITLKPEEGGRYLLTEPTVGFYQEAPDLNQMLPSIKNPSDHYAVGATLIPRIAT